MRSNFRITRRLFRAPTRTEFAPEWTLARAATSFARPRTLAQRALVLAFTLVFALESAWWHPAGSTKRDAIKRAALARVHKTRGGVRWCSHQALMVRVLVPSCGATLALCVRLGL